MNQIANFAMNILMKNPNVANNPQAQQLIQMKHCNVNACCGSTNC